MNKAIITGRLTSDPELRQTTSGISKCQFTVAVPEEYKKTDGTRGVDFLTVIAWREKAEFITRYFKKGNGILIVGQNKSDEYEKNGQKTSFKYILVESVEFFGYKNNSTNSNGGSNSAVEFNGIATDEVPFG